MQRMRFACWVSKDTDKHTVYMILIAYPQQQWLQEWVSVLRYTYIVNLKAVNTVF